MIVGQQEGCEETSMSQTKDLILIPVFSKSKTMHALDHLATVIRNVRSNFILMSHTYHVNVLIGLPSCIINLSSSDKAYIHTFF